MDNTAIFALLLFSFFCIIIFSFFLSFFRFLLKKTSSCGGTKLKRLKKFGFQTPSNLYLIMTLDHGFYDFHKKSSSDLQNEGNFFGYE